MFPELCERLNRLLRRAGFSPNVKSPESITLDPVNVAGNTNFFRSDHVVLSEATRYSGKSTFNDALKEGSPYWLSLHSLIDCYGILRIKSLRSYGTKRHLPFRG
jgi:hypothetical protein